MTTKAYFLFILLYLCSFSSCSAKHDEGIVLDSTKKDSLIITQTISQPVVVSKKLILEKELLYDRHTLADSYPYKDTTRSFQWDKIRLGLRLLDSINSLPARWGILQNYRNRNGEAPLVQKFHRDAYKRVSDSLGIERYQSVPLYLLDDTLKPIRYGRDGSLVKLINDKEHLYHVQTLYTPGEWRIPAKYVKPIADTIRFHKAIFVDVTNQNITTVEKVKEKWLIRSMNPATTGRHKPPYAQETPLGIFVIQEKKVKMIYLVDGSKETGGFAPYASRFTNGAYIHAVPVNAPRKSFIEYSPSLGTTPRSHMCVRNATSHAKFIFDWATTQGTIVFVIK